MTNEAFQSYKSERYDSEIEYYENRSRRNKIYYYTFQWVVIILSASIPVLVSLISERYKLITVIISTILAIGTTALKTFKFQENWINFRAVVETLKKELFFYNAGIEGYESSDSKNCLFVDRVESLISREHTLWIGSQKSTTSEKKEE